jgi:hypothetical protein
MHVVFLGVVGAHWGICVLLCAEGNGRSCTTMPQQRWSRSGEQIKQICVH